MDIDSSDDDFDIDKSNSSEPSKKVFRASHKIKHKNKNKKQKKAKSKNKQFSDSSEDEESEQSLMSLIDSDKDIDAPITAKRRSALQRFKNKVQRKKSDQSDDETCGDNKLIGKKRRRREYDIDEYDDDYSEFNEFNDEHSISTAWKGKNNNYDGDGLKLFYRNTLGIETETETESESESEPMKKKRKLNNNLNRNKLTSKLAENQLKQSFGTLPVSSDIICKICKFLTLTQISSTLVLINHEFCQYFNTDEYWQKFYCSLSKDIITVNETKIIKKYKLKINGDNKIYKRRILWYYTIVHAVNNKQSIFNQSLMKYIPSLLPIPIAINEAEEYNKDKYSVDRMFAIRLYLVKQCVVMHYNKKHANNCGNNKNMYKYGIDQIYRYCNEELNVIMPDIKYSPYINQYVAIWCNNKYQKMDNLQGDSFYALYNKFNLEWKSQNDIFNVFRYINQLYIEYILNGMVKENVKDLQYLVSLQAFYESATGNATKVIKNLCDDGNTIHNIIDIGDDCESQHPDDTMQVTIQSPKIILHHQIKYIMDFINNYNDNGYLSCELITLMDEMKERNIISSLEEFENLKALVDRNQFQLNKDCITCICE